MGFRQATILYTLAWALVAACAPPKVASGQTEVSPETTTSLPGSMTTGGSNSGAPLPTGGTGTGQGTGGKSPGATSGGIHVDDLVDLLTPNMPGIGVGGTATCFGRVDNQPFDPAPTNAVFDVLGDSNGVAFVAIVVVSNDPNVCTTRVSQHEMLANSSSIIMEMYGVDNNGSLAPLVFNQNYGIGTDPATRAYISGWLFSPLDGQCQSTLPDRDGVAIVGAVGLSSLTAAEAVGQFTVGVGAASAGMHGGWTAAPCPGLANLALNSQAALSCVP